MSASRSAPGMTAIAIGPSGDLEIHTRAAGGFVRSVRVTAGAPEDTAKALLGARLIVAGMHFPGGIPAALNALTAASRDPAQQPRWETTTVRNPASLRLLLEAGWEPYAVFGPTHHLRRQCGTVIPF
jgi:hypothetical protein